MVITILLIFFIFIIRKLNSSLLKYFNFHTLITESEFKINSFCVLRSDYEIENSWNFNVLIYEG